MKNYKLVKGSLAILVFAAALICPAMLGWTAVLADDEANSTQTVEKAQLYMDFLGLAESRADRGPAESRQTKPETFTNGSVFWVGIRIDDVTKAIYEENGTEYKFLTDDGIQDLEIGIEYDPQYVKPCGDLSTGTEVLNKTAWAKLIQDWNIGTAGNTMWDEKLYDFMVDYSAMDATPDEADGRVQNAKNGWKMQFISVMKKTGVTGDNRFKGVSTGEDGSADDGYYLLRLPFRVIAQPTDGKIVEQFHLALGPSSFVMTAGDGSVGADSVVDTQTYAWEEENRTHGQNNLSNYFVYHGDLNIYTPDDVDTLSELEISYQTTGDDGSTTDNVAGLFMDEDRKTPLSFAASCETYYIGVPEGTDKVNLKIQSLQCADPVVKHCKYGETTATDITMTEDASIAGKWTGSITLVTPGDADETGYLDTIKITVNNGHETAEKVYTVHIYRTVPTPDEPEQEPYIKLNYGNSPVGEIMKDDTKWREYTFGAEFATDEDKKAEWQRLAKEHFIANNGFKDSKLTPKSMEAQLEKKFGYTKATWFSDTEIKATSDEGKSLLKDPERHMDLNETAIFVYNFEAFVDPGFVAQDSHGNDVAVVDREITVKRVKKKSASSYTELVDIVDIKANEKVSNVADASIKVEDAGSDYLMDFLLYANGSYVRPDIYEMTYSFVDPYTDDHVLATRNVIVLGYLGDTNLNGGINNLDTSLINKFVAGSGTVKGFIRGENIAESAYRVFVYRVVDTNTNGGINNLDTSLINRYVAGTDKTMQQLYAKLPNTVPVLDLQE